MVLRVLPVVIFCIVLGLISAAAAMATTPPMFSRSMGVIMSVYTSRLIESLGSLQSLDLCFFLVIRCFSFLENREELFSLSKS